MTAPKLLAGLSYQNFLQSKFKANEQLFFLQECNPLVDFKPNEAITRVREMFEAVDQSLVEVTNKDSAITLSVTARISQFKVKYETDLTKTEDGKFMEMITIPMIQTIQFLECQQKMLCHSIEKKDRELEEYQMEKGLISRTDLITEKFEPNSLTSSSEKLILNVFGNSEKFMGHIMQEYGGVAEEVAEVEVESWNKGKRKRKIYDRNTASAAAKLTKIVYK
ncbi:hypothetical protein JTB14_023363 [Gonioctena quinquepunctata]|nr:hypothetical protein JTB14_023363 [Gonioctena quinquepunctata]